VIQRDLHGLAGSQRAIRHRLFEELIVVILGSNVALQQSVDVRIDEAGQQRHVAEVDHLGVRGDGAADRFDLVAADDDDRRRNDRAAAAVDHPRGAKRDDFRRGVSRECCESEKRKGESRESPQSRSGRRHQREPTGGIDGSKKV